MPSDPNIMVLTYSPLRQYVFRRSNRVEKWDILEHTGRMQVQCPKCEVIAAIGTTKWFFDGGECMELRGTQAGDAKDYRQCQTLAEAIDKAEKNLVTRPPQKPLSPR